MRETLVLRDEHNQALTCEILKQVTIEGLTYALVTPVDAYVEVLVWTDGGEDAEDPEADFEGTLDEPSDEELERILPTARAVMAELDLNLQVAGFDLLIVEGEIPEAEDEDILEIAKEEEEVEEYQLLATFFHDDRQYGIFTPLDPLLLFAAQPATGDPYLLTPDFPDEVFEKVQVRLLDLDEE
jgi:hypothetical protein